MKQGENGWEGLKSYFYMYVGCTRVPAASADIL
jgi:hypothetical protein